MSDDVDGLAARLRALSPEERARLLAQVGMSPTVPPADIGVSGDAETVQQVNLAPGGHVGQVVARQEHHYHAGSADLPQRRARYLEHLAAQQDALPLQGIAERPDRGEGLALHRVYTLLAVGEKVELACIAQDQPSPYFRDGQVPLKSPDHKDTYGQLLDAYHPDHVLPDRAVIHMEWLDQLRADQVVERRFVLSRRLLASEAITRHQRLVLLGDPGSGKSTFVRHLAWGLAERALQGDSTAAMPVILPLRTLAGHLAQGGSLPLAVLASLRATMAECCVQQPDDLLESALAVPAALLLLDGLDEVPLEATARSANRETTLRAVQAFLTLHRGTRALITCRTRAFDDGLRAALGWPVETLAPFTLGQIRHFARAWYAELAAKGQLAQAQADHLGEALPAAITSPQRTRLREMAETPLLLTMMALVLANEGELPRDRPQLYRRILLLLLGQWDKTGKQGESLFEAAGLPDWGSERILPLLDRLSYEAHRDARSEDGRGRIGRGDLLVALLDFFTHARVAQPGEATRVALAYVEQRSGLLSADGPQSYAFAHLTLQEYCAGRYIALNEEPPPGSTLPPDPVSLAMGHRGTDRWREPIMLGAGLMRQRDLDALLGDLIDREGKDPVVWYRDLILAAEIGKDRDWGYLGTGRVVKVAAHQRALRTGLAALLADSTQPLPVAERVRAGFLLGDLDDPRLPVTVEQWRTEWSQRNEHFGQPTGYWCYVRQGDYSIDEWEKNQQSATVQLPAFWIARYPITVAQYVPFVAEGYGKDTQRWWTPEGRKWKKAHTQPWGWEQPTYAGPNQPVIGVTWYEVTAFCAWLSERLEGMLPKDCVVRLPTEAEWEAAAAYNAQMQRQTYPWGKEKLTSERAICSASKLNRPAPVGCCPSGTAACGAMDMAGNVWEWTASSHKGYPAQSGVVQKDFTDYDVPVRGGGYNNNETNIRCGARVRGYPGDDDVFDVRGVRVCVSPLNHSR